MMEKGMKVFGIGLNKTGTKTLGACFTMLGLRNKSYDLELLKCYQQGDFGPVFNIADQYDSFEDWPWPLFYKELDGRYPDAKFILTLRKDPETWFRSLCSHAERFGPTLAREIAYGYRMPLEAPEHHQEIYRQHEQNVVNHFSGRNGKLLVIKWEENPSWDTLCSFLDSPFIPDLPIPHENRTPEKFSK